MTETAIPRQMSQEEILAELPRIREGIMKCREILLANLVMIGETPAPTFHEEYRVKLMQDRFIMSGLDNASTDEVGNALGVVPGLSEGEGSILVVAHADSVHDMSHDHTVTVQQDTVTGAGLSDNALSLAVIASLPSFLQTLGIELRHNLILMGGARSLGRANLEGLKFFLENSKVPIGHGICLDSLLLGRTSYRSIGMIRGEIQVAVPKEYDWTRYGLVGAIQVLTDIVTRISEIPLPRKPQTFVVMGSIHGGNTYNVIPTNAYLRFEIRGESAEMVDKIFGHIEEIADEIGSSSRAEVRVQAVARRTPGGIEYGHPLARMSRKILKALDLEPQSSPSTSELTSFIEAGIRAITIGLTDGDEDSESRDVLQIVPMFTGVTQLIALLLAIDNGHCEDD